MIYLDHAAATPLDPRVKQAMEHYFTTEFGNPSSLSSIGKRAKEAVESSRKKVASLLHCKPEEIIFTSGGTESINLAIQGIAWAQRKKGKNHIITSKAEHAAVLETCKHMEDKGFKVTYVDVDEYGAVSPESIEAVITGETLLISIMYANNELGTINPIKEISEVAKKHNIAFHTDACQAGLLDIDVENLSVTLLSLNGSKIYGPKGCGVLYVKYGTPLQAVVYGGGQEFDIRPGTQNVPAIVGFAKALELITNEKEEQYERIEKLRDELEKELLEKIPNCKINGKNRLPCTLNISIKGIESEAALLQLDEHGIMISSGSACESNAIEPSHVLKSIGLPDVLAHGTLRFSLGKDTTQQDISKVAEVLPGIVKELREMSPSYLMSDRV